MSGNSVDAITHIYYDLEFLGDLNEDVGHCRVYEIGAVNDSGDEFHSFVDPGEPYDDPVVGSYDRDVVRDSRTLQEVVDDLIRWMGTGEIIMISHGNFRSDHLVLRAATFPPRIRFADSLMIARIMFTLPSYSLSGMYEYFLQNPHPSPHTALADACALRNIMHMWEGYEWYMVTYAPGEYALSNYTGIGAKTESTLAYYGFSLSNSNTWGAVNVLHASQQVRMWDIIRAHAGTPSTPTLPYKITRMCHD